MTSDEFSEIMETLHWPNEHLSKILGCDVSMVESWARGDRQVPFAVRKWLDTLATFYLWMEVESPIYLPPISGDKADGRFSSALTADESIALRQFMADYDIPTPEDAVSAALRDCLVGHGYLELGIDTETHGEA